MSGKVCMITGANSGIGKAAALGLARLGATVIMVCRDSHRGERARAEITGQSGNGSVELMICDLSSQGSIHRLAEEFKQRHQRLHVLVNNA
ncbi:MAG: SDR family NAD(P)-dependent oxidoreductase, partial [Chloroflexi bacterium]|nr:SDR family NAD(P)-dependent oxidoreductase [Chloroflexota bacterium]